jgi:outer membrane receptor protein involved in Fe transport
LASRRGQTIARNSDRQWRASVSATAARNLVNLYAGYAFNSDVMAGFSIENLPVSFQLR